MEVCDVLHHARPMKEYIRKSYVKLFIFTILMLIGISCFSTTKVYAAEKANNNWSNKFIGLWRYDTHQTTKRITFVSYMSSTNVEDIVNILDFNTFKVELKNEMIESKSKYYNAFTFDKNALDNTKDLITYYSTTYLNSKDGTISGKDKVEYFWYRLCKV